MATVALPPVGRHLGRSPIASVGKSSRAALLASRVRHRVADWLRREPPFDAWCSYAAFALALAAAATAFFAIPQF